MTKNTGSSRRDFLIKTFSLAPAVAIGGLTAVTETSAMTSEKNAASSEPASVPRDYQPTFFTAEEFAFIKAAVARLIPADERGPGALEAGVPEFIDRQLQTPYASGANWYMQGPFHPDAGAMFGYQLPLVPKDIYRLGVTAAIQYAKDQYGKPFTELSEQQQDAFLTEMEQEKAQFTNISAKVFFSMLLQNTREGFFSDPVHGGNQGLAGWKLVGFPGARADFMDWVERNEKYPFPPVSIRGQRG